METKKEYEIAEKYKKHMEEKLQLNTTTQYIIATILQETTKNELLEEQEPEPIDWDEEIDDDTYQITAPIEPPKPPKREKEDENNEIPQKNNKSNKRRS